MTADLKPAYLPSIQDIIAKYDALLLDLWGVIHDGKTLYPTSKATLGALRAAGKKIIFLSNAPRRSHVVATALQGMGVGEELYDGIVTSGETAFYCLQHPGESPFRPRGDHYLYVGLERDRAILDGLHYREVKRPEQAHFVLLSHSFEDNQPLVTLKPLLEDCVKRGLPVVCINPDKEVVRLTGERVYCAGALAQEYRMMGGEVFYFGKPHRAVYEACLRLLPGMERSRILAVGDTLGTDILGGNRTRLDTALITGGVLKTRMGMPGTDDYRIKCNLLFDEEQVWPRYVLPEFA